MGLQFFHSYLLWASGLVLLPILIHLLRRRRIKIVRLPTFEFLLRTHRRIARRSQLRNWLLLALRVSAVSLIVFLAARPLLSGSGWLGGGFSPLHLTVLIDNSASMGYRIGSGTRLSLAKRTAAGLIRSLSGDDRVAVLPTVPGPGGGEPEDMSGRAALARLDKIPQTAAAGDAVRVLRAAMERAAASKDRRRIVILSDMAKTGWEALRIRGLRRLSPHTRLQFVRIAPERGTDDVAIHNVRLRPWPPRAASTLAVVLRVANRGSKARKKVGVSLYMGKDRAGFSEVDLGAGEEKEVSFRAVAPAEGFLEGRLELSADSLAATNRYFFSAEMSRRNRVLIVDGDPRRGLVESESFYLSNALRASAPGGDSPILVEVVAGYELGKVEWDRYDMVVACNVGKWPPGKSEELRRFVERGGGLLLAGGALAGGRLPGQGWLPAVWGAPRGVKIPQGPRVSPENLRHPIFSLMGANPSRLFAKTKIRRLISLKPAGGGKVLLALKDGTPVLVAGRSGAGKIALWASTCDREWTDIPVRPVFVPFMRGMVHFLGVREGGTVAGIDAGRPIVIRPRANSKGDSVRIQGPGGIRGLVRLKLAGPDNRARAAGAAPPRGPGARLEGRFTNTVQAGFYEMNGPEGKQMLAANVPASEAILRAMSEAELQSRLPGLDVVVRSIQAEGPESQGAIPGRVDLGVYLLLFLAGIFAFEGALADRS
ncbi:MAG: BatA domain-containing protein [Nitrospinota bacterium]